MEINCCRNIVINMNSGYFPYSLVMLQSLFDNKAENCYCIYLLYSDMKQWELDYIESFCRENKGRFVPVKVDNKVFRGFPLNPRWSIETYYRLLISELLPDALTRVLYLDIDVIIDGNISELFQVDLKSDYLAACEDLYEKIDYRSLNNTWGRKEDIKYFNAGVMVLNLEEIRKNICFNDYIDVIRATQGNLPYMDQDILNYLLGEKTKLLSPQYNCVIGSRTIEKQQGIIYHFGTPDKPWIIGKTIAHKELWWKYARRVTDYKNMIEKYVKEKQICVNV